MSHDHSHGEHSHDFNPEKKHAERSTGIVFIITALIMIIEIVAGWITHSMALFADGWHMGTHALALGISLVAYILARRYAADKRFALGTWKIEILGAYTSAILLGIMGIFVAIYSMQRIISPLSIDYNTAIFIAFFGLVVNLVCALILGHDGDHSHGHDHHAHPALDEHDEHPEEIHDHPEKHDEHHHDHKDLNLQSVYIHVIADALTSVFAILALLGAKYFGWNWLDPLMGMVAAIPILRWTYILLQDTSSILLDRTTSFHLIEKITAEIEGDQESHIKDIHVWKVGQHKFACMLSINAKHIYSTHDYQHRLGHIHKLAHTTIEVEHHK